MKFTSFSLPARGGLVAVGLYLLALTEVPRLGVALLGLVGVATVIAELMPTHWHARAWKFAATLGWCATLLLPAGLWSAASRLTWFHAYYAVIAWLMAAALTLAVLRLSRRRSWKCLAAFWFGLGELIWLAQAYTQNRVGDFYVGLAIAIALLIALKRSFRLPPIAILTSNTLLLLFLFLPVADWLARPPALPPASDVAGDDYLYSAALQDPEAHARYWNRYLAQYDRLNREMAFLDPENVLPYRTRSNLVIRFFEGTIRLNNCGFRGRDVAETKGSAYRILALGESTTFGFPLTAEHKPWAECLEQLIRERLHPARPVEVLNTGMPRYTLEDNLYRLRTQLLALRPDMIISYHGWNGFPWLYPELPPIYVKHLPDYRRRPSRLLTECEYRLKLIRFKRSLRANPVLRMPTVAELLNSRYGRAYRSLIELCRANDIKLVLANYSMAVNAHSDLKLVEFYREGSPAIYPCIQVNVMHSTLVAALAAQHTNICFVDTHPHLDGEHDKFIDAVHLAPAGDRQLAETIFEGISNFLQHALSKPAPEPTAAGG